MNILRYDEFLNEKKKSGKKPKFWEKDEKKGDEKSAEKKEEPKKGLTDAQKKLPEGLQKAILKKQK